MGLANKGRDVGGIATDTLTQPELAYLLKVIHKTTFEGKDVLLLADITQKLQNQLKSK